MSTTRGSTFHVFCTYIFLKGKIIAVNVQQNKTLWFLFSREKESENFSSQFGMVLFLFLMYFLDDLAAGLKVRYSEELLQRWKERVEAIYPSLCFPNADSFSRSTLFWKSFSCSSGVL